MEESRGGEKGCEDLQKRTEKSVLPPPPARKGGDFSDAKRSAACIYDIDVFCISYPSSEPTDLTASK